jgi:hypothetical protein
MSKSNTKKAKRTTTTAALPERDLVTGQLSPVLELVRHGSVGELDDLELEILRDEQAAFPVLPDVVRTSSMSDWVARAGRAS